LLKDFEPLEVERVLDACEASGFLDDARYAGLLLRSHIAKGHGTVRIRQALAQKGLSKDTISQALDSCDCDWFALARERAIKKYGVKPADDAKEKARRIRYLLGQGFSFEQVAHALNADPLDEVCC
jgi:regulatory protein